MGTGVVSSFPQVSSLLALSRCWNGRSSGMIKLGTVRTRWTIGHFPRGTWLQRRTFVNRPTSSQLTKTSWELHNRTPTRNIVHSRTIALEVDPPW